MQWCLITLVNNDDEGHAELCIPTGLLLAGVRTQEFVDVVESVQMYWNVAWAFAVATRLARAAAAVANFMMREGEGTTLCNRRSGGAL